MYYHIKVTPEFGRGLYCAHEIRPNQIITQCEILVLSPRDTEIVNSTELKHYTFAFDLRETSMPRDCIVLGDGELFNHSAMPNVGYKLENVGDRNVMVFYALKSILPGEQLFIDYSADVMVDSNEYVTSKSLVG